MTRPMNVARRVAWGVVLAAAWWTVTAAGETARPAVAIDQDDLGGIVSGAAGPEAGVWVIAETRDLPTRFAKIVVTDDRGRYVIPDLPAANYTVWVRGYGLVDSPKRPAKPGATLNPRAAAEYYPAGYWYSLMKVPAESEFPGTGPEGNGINPIFKSQAEYVRLVKNNGCFSCHQLGSKGTREL